VAVQSPWDISVEELKKLRDEGAEFTLVDVREQHEYEICHLDGVRSARWRTGSGSSTRAPTSSSTAARAAAVRTP
jgi:rhodanese-related sulfurtransferase